MYSCVLIKWKVAFKPKLTLRGEGTHHNRTAVFIRCRNRPGALQKVSDVLKEPFARLKSSKCQMEQSL